MAASKDASKSPPRRRRLGRGLTSLMSVPVTEATAPPPETTGQADRGPTDIRLIGLDEIQPGRERIALSSEHDASDFGVFSCSPQRITQHVKHVHGE